MMFKARCALLGRIWGGIHRISSVDEWFWIAGSALPRNTPNRICCHPYHHLLRSAPEVKLILDRQLVSRHSFSRAMTYQTWPVLALKSMPDMLSMSFTKIGGLKPMPCHACKKLRCHLQFLVGLSHVSHLFCDILLISIAIKSNDEYFQSPKD